MPAELFGPASVYLAAVLEKDQPAAETEVRKLVKDGSSLADIYAVLGAAQVEVGALWEKGVITVSDEHFATQTTVGCIKMAAELLKKFRRKTSGFAALLTVRGEFHDIGLRMMEELLKSEGYDAEIVPSERFPSELMETAKQRKVDVVCFAATMPSSVPRVIEAVRFVKSTPGLTLAKVVVGGPAFTADQAKLALIGPDGKNPPDLIAQDLSEAVNFIISSNPN